LAGGWALLLVPVPSFFLVSFGGILSCECCRYYLLYYNLNYLII
jgi:hypothetical protein